MGSMFFGGISRISLFRYFSITLFRYSGITIKNEITRKNLSRRNHFVTVMIKLAIVIRMEVIEMAKDERFETSRLAARVPLGST